MGFGSEAICGGYMLYYGQLSSELSPLPAYSNWSPASGKRDRLPAAKKEKTQTNKMIQSDLDSEYSLVLYHKYWVILI